MDDKENNQSKQLLKPESYQFLGSLTERVFFLVFLTVITAAPLLFREGFPAHADWHSHIANAFHFKKCFFQGEFLPRWIESGMYGYGTPKFNYYAPLLYYMFTFFEVLFRDPVLSMKATLIMTIILTVVFGYIYLRSHTSPLSATIGTVFIIFSPAIHIYTYNNNFPTNTLALPFVFIALYGIDNFDKNKDFDYKSYLITTFGYAGMILSHLATGFIFSLIMIPYFVLSLYFYKTRKFVQNFVFSMISGIGLSAFYLFPAASETNLVHSEVLAEGAGWDYSKNYMFTYLDRLPSDGYYWGIFDHRYYEVTNALFSLIGLVCAVILLANFDRIKNYINEPKRAVIAISMFAITFLMMTPVSFFVWVMIKQMKTLQFPWRFMSLVLPFACLIIAYTYDLIAKFVKEKIEITGFRFLTYSIVFTLVILLYVHFVNIFRWQWIEEQVFLKHAMNVVWQNREYHPNLNNDPKWKDQHFERDFSPTLFSTNPMCDFTLIKWLSHDRVFQVFSGVDHQVKLRIFYFPGWFVYIDSKKVPMSMDPSTGAIVVNVPPGRHEIEARFELTDFRKLSMFISLAFLIIYLNILFRKFSKGIKFKNIQKPPESIEVQTV